MSGYLCDRRIRQKAPEVRPGVSAKQSEIVFPIRVIFRPVLLEGKPSSARQMQNDNPEALGIDAALSPQRRLI
ncbi:hypothetical protein LB518_23120 [Mesorhizobium sp. BR1-1-16]|uniref:hypothetical protein n=1 Tax=Mesorhizobium sp. BR1-1-16 TaxID=2876653 RepID=UPI001CCFB04E|nr:hypothetical protein [Mesorhizobium sp. BR1-1-16]MBZ9939207.1 hypothetical protein [Mesorhizobium sp. BR1-1-16]